MKYSASYKNKILKKLLNSEINPETYCIEDINLLKKQITFVSSEELNHYLNILEWEHLIDIEKDEEQNLKYIYIIPCNKLNRIFSI
jgi:plasmid maintenance system killer protein